MDVLATTHRIRGSGNSEVDWERVKSSLSTIAKNRSLAAIRNRYYLLEGTAKQNKIKKETQEVKPRVSDLVVESEESSQSRGESFLSSLLPLSKLLTTSVEPSLEGSFYGGWSFVIDGGGAPPLQLSQENSRHAASLQAAPSHASQGELSR